MVTAGDKAVDQARRAPAGLVNGFAGRWVERAYALAVARRNRAFDRGRGVVRLDRPVVSVGNVSVGGTGKTPMVAHLARHLLAHGHRPCIAMRGYRPHGGQSDEAWWYARALPDVPVVVRPDRVAGLRALFGSDRGQAIDCVLLDDGFQHRRVARDLDVVLVSATRDPFADRLLPAGWLREPVASLSRADVIVVTHAQAVAPQALAALVDRLRSIAGPAFVAVARHCWRALRVTEGGEERTEAVDWLAGRRVLVACAIGQPAVLVDQAVAAGAEVVAAVIRRDHDAFGPRVVRAVRHRASDARAEAILITDKDWAKLHRVPAWRWPCPLVRPQLELRFDTHGREVEQAVLQAVRR